MENQVSPTTTQDSNWTVRLGFVLLVPIFILVVVISLNTSWRMRFQSFLRGPERKLLSSVVGDLRNDGTSIKILKFRTRNGIVLEFLGSSDTGARPLLDRVILSDPYDGHFDFAGEATRLAIVDLDGDNHLELIAPTYDENLVAHLNIFKYNSVTKKFDPF